MSEECDGIGPKVDPNDVADATEESLRNVESELERIGMLICGIRGSATTHGRIGLAVREVQEAINGVFHMRKEAVNGEM